MKNSKYILLIILFVNSFYYAEEWQVKKSEMNLVKFISTTPVLDFEGITDKIDGYVYWKGEELFSENNEIYFEVDINSIETGNGKRNRDMREDVLETNKWPTTYFKGTVVDVKKNENEIYILKSKGKMFIHGVEKDIQIIAKASIRNNMMNITTDFSVFLKDYNIESPSLLAFIKVAQEIKLHLNFYLQKVTEN